jgi:DNA-binding response OmpR family regulator
VADVLVVDDDRDVREMLATLLTLEGYRVDTAPDGLEALTVIRANRPRVMVVDLMMPRMSGEALREAQLAESTMAAIPFIVISAREDGAAIAERLRADGYVQKPPHLDRLIGLVRTLVGR